jgi:hypothetical protein
MTFARALASYFRRRGALPRSPTYADLIHACQDLGIPVYTAVGLCRPGYCITGDDSIILIRWNATASQLAHELYHWLTADPDLPAVIYAYSSPGERLGPDEDQANEFARALCG